MSTTAEAKQGHVAHTQSADDQRGLPGPMPRPIKVVMMGAGSAFTPRLLSDVLQVPGGQGGEICLVDIDRERLDTMQQVIERLLGELGRSDEWRLRASDQRREVLPGADYVVNCIEVSGTACVRHDNDIPLKYGVSQCIGDTIGPGGLFKGLRTIPVWLAILKDCEELCPDALILNYTNPMNMMCLAAARTSSMAVVGLCHSVQGTSHLLAKRAGVPIGEMEWECAGINHLAWFTTLKHKGEDLYPRLMAQAEKDIAAGKGLDGHGGDLVRKDMMLHFGAFITESSGHLSEYLPYYRKRKDLQEKYCLPGYEGEESFYADNWPTWRKNADEKRMQMVRGEEPVVLDRSWEYASWIIEAREKDSPFRIHGNFGNQDRDAGALISNLPHDGCVEVACMVDRNGFNPCRYGRLPAQMAAICDSNMRMFDLAATAAIERSVEAAIHALSVDPLCAACCSPAEIKAMTLELFETEKDFLPDYH